LLSYYVDCRCCRRRSVGIKSKFLRVLGHRVQRDRVHRIGIFINTTRHPLCTNRNRNVIEVWGPRRNRSIIFHTLSSRFSVPILSSQFSIPISIPIPIRMRTIKWRPCGLQRSSDYMRYMIVYHLSFALYLTSGQ